jgi:hypothetical protein
MARVLFRFRPAQPAVDQHSGGKGFVREYGRRQQWQ